MTALSRLALSILAGQADGCRPDSGEGRGRALRRRTAAWMAVTARSSAGKNSTVRCPVVSSPRPLGV